MRVIKTFFVQFFCVFLPTLLNVFYSVCNISVLYCAHLCMIYSLGISNFLEKISSLSHSVVFLCFSAWASHVALVVKNPHPSAGDAGDVGSILGKIP